MKLLRWIQCRRTTTFLAIVLASLTPLAITGATAQRNWLEKQQGASEKGNPENSKLKTCPQQAQPTDPLLGPRTRDPGRWVGRQSVPSNLPIVVMAGHADSQAMASAGTPGFAVDVRKAAPMDSLMRDELFWNFKVQEAVVRIGKTRGLNISSYRPPSLTIRNDNDPLTNWSQARVRSAKGQYILEIHFDAYRPHGFGSGLIPAINRPLNTVDESLGSAFGRFPRNFRGGLGGPRRGIGILEIGMLEDPLEARLRNPKTRSQTVNCLAERVVEALLKGVS